MKTELSYETFTKREDLYVSTHLVVRDLVREDLGQILEGAVGNRAGYGSESAAKRQEMLCRAALEAGHDSVFATPYNGLHLHLRWLHVDGGDGMLYARPWYDDLGRTFEQHELAMKFLRRLGAAVERRIAFERNGRGSGPEPVSDRSFSDPGRVVEVIRKMKASIPVRYDRDSGWFFQLANKDAFLPPRGAPVSVGSNVISICGR
jgi:hypothetical protein